MFQSDTSQADILLIQIGVAALCQKTHFIAVRGWPVNILLLFSAKFFQQVRSYFITIRYTRYIQHSQLAVVVLICQPLFNGFDHDVLPRNLVIEKQDYRFFVHDRNLNVIEKPHGIDKAVPPEFPYHLDTSSSK